MPAVFLLENYEKTYARNIDPVKTPICQYSRIAMHLS